MGTTAVHSVGHSRTPNQCPSSPSANTIVKYKYKGDESSLVLTNIYSIYSINNWLLIMSCRGNLLDIRALNSVQMFIRDMLALNRLYSFTSLHYTLSEKFQCKYSLHSNTIFLIYFLRSANENSRITSFVSLPARATPISPFMNFQWYMEAGRRSDFIESTPAICCFQFITFIRSSIIELTMK